MKRLFLLILILLVPIGGYLWYRQSPEQQVKSTVDRFLENIEHRKISTRRKADVHEALTKVLAPKVRFQGESPIPNDELTIDDIILKIDQLHLLSNFFEINEIEQRIQIIANKAQVYRTIDVRAAVGIGKNQYKAEETWELIIDLEKEHDWRITGVRGTKP